MYQFDGGAEGKDQLIMVKIDPQRQTCKVCGRADKFDFSVPDNVWASIVPEEYRKRVVCLACFDEFARQAKVDYTPYLRSLYFAGDRAVFTFKVTGASLVESA